MRGKEKKFLLDILFEKELINQDQLIAVLSLQKKKGGKVVDYLLELGYLTEKTVISFFIKECGYHYVNLNYTEVDQSAVKEIPQEIAAELVVLPIRKARNFLAVVMRDPLDQEVIARLEKTTVYEIIPLVGRKEDIIKAINKYYKFSLLLDDVGLKYKSL